MKILVLLLFFISGTFQSLFSQELFHALKFTASEPVITERCANLNKIKKLQCGYVEEYLDKNSRCVKLIFFKNPDKLFSAVDLPSIVEYEWTDSSLIEILYEDEGKIFSPKLFVRPNKNEYIISQSKVVKIKKFYNEKLVNVKSYKNYALEDAVFFFMYSGCQVKFNKEYQLSF